jgi:hypothetical protein
VPFPFPCLWLFWPYLSAADLPLSADAKKRGPLERVPLFSSVMVRSG